MKKYIFFLCLVLLFIVTGCDIRISAPIKVSELLNGQNTTVYASLKINVGFSCDERAIEDVKKALKKANLNAQYTNKCEENKNYAYALFSMPVEIVKDKNSPQINNGFWLNFKNNELSIQTADNFSIRFQQENQELGLTDFEILLTNDMNEDIYIKPYVVFINSESTFDKIRPISPYETVSIQLSDVANKLITNPSTYYTVFILSKDSDMPNDDSFTKNLYFY